jgi:hypothetical protein
MRPPNASASSEPTTAILCPAAVICPCRYERPWVVAVVAGVVSEEVALVVVVLTVLVLVVLEEEDDLLVAEVLVLSAIFVAD